MGHGISPVVQVPEVGHPGSVRRIDSDEIEQEAESLKVLPDALDGWVPLVKFEIRRELRLDGCSKASRYGGSTMLRTFRVKVPAEPLKMTA